MPRWSIEGHAIVSVEGYIADEAGLFPPALADDADWARFQAELDRAAAVVLGRASHEATPNAAGRLRVVMSRQAQGLERRDDGWWWDPAVVDLPEMLAAVAPQGGLIGVPGGRDVFDFFLRRGFDAFHLTANRSCSLPAGRGVFSGVGPGRSAEQALAEAGYRPGPEQMLNPARGVALKVWRGMAASAESSLG